VSQGCTSKVCTQQYFVVLPTYKTIQFRTYKQNPKYWEPACSLYNTDYMYSTCTVRLITMHTELDWIVQCFTSPPTQYSYMGDGFYRSKDPTNSIEVLKEATKENNTKNKENTKFTCIDTQKIDKYSIQV